MPSVDETGAVIETHAFSTTRAGCRALLRWMTRFGQLQRVGVEQTGSYGAGVVRHLALAGIPVLEVTGADAIGGRRSATHHERMGERNESRKPIKTVSAEPGRAHSGPNVRPLGASGGQVRNP